MKMHVRQSVCWRIAVLIAFLCFQFNSSIFASEKPEPKAFKVLNPLPVSAVGKLDGYIGQRIRANTEGYLKPFDIDRYVKMFEDKKQRDWWWIGEQPGKWLESAVLAGGQAGDRELEQRARAILQRLSLAQ